jgi:hypothetical protein
MYDRAQDMVATTKRRPSVAPAVAKDINCSALIDFAIDGGAYTTLAGGSVSRHDLRGRSVLLPERAVAAAPSRPIIRRTVLFEVRRRDIFALERHMNRVAAAVGLSRRNSAAELYSSGPDYRDRTSDQRSGRHGRPDGARVCAHRILR